MRPQVETDVLDRGEFVKLAYRLGLSRATGVLTIHAGAGEPGPRREVLVIRRGYLMASDTDALGRATGQRLARIAALDGARYCFDGGAAAYPPGGALRQFSLALWARKHLESQVDAALAQQLVQQLAGVRLALRKDLVPDDALLDDTDRRILAAMVTPRRLDQIWPLARTPRFRLLTFVYFLRQVGAVELQGVSAPAPRPPTADGDARRLLGVDASADRATVKRAYRRLARALHPDLHPSATSERRRLLERKLSEINAAYRQLIGD